MGLESVILGGTRKIWVVLLELVMKPFKETWF